MITINNALIDILMNHRSIRSFKDKGVDEETINTIIQCGQMAPTSNNLQAYTIIDIKDDKKKEELAQISGGQKWVVEAPLVLLFCADFYRIKKYCNMENTDILANAELYTTAVVDTALAAQKSLIAAQALGLGGVIVGGIKNNTERVHSMFQLPDLVSPLFLLCLGYPDKDPGLKPRFPKEIVYKIDNYDTRKDDELVNEYNETMKEYYRERTNGKSTSNWSEKCSRALSFMPRDEVDSFLRSIGFLKK